MGLAHHALLCARRRVRSTLRDFGTRDLMPAFGARRQRDGRYAIHEPGDVWRRHRNGGVDDGVSTGITRVRRGGDVVATPGHREHQK